VRDRQKAFRLVWSEIMSFALRVAGFGESNNVPNTTGTKYKIIAGHPIATSYAEQIVDVRTYQPEKRFGDAVKGLHVYGAKVLRPQNLAGLIANRS
jgi:hypothetical protein